MENKKLKILFLYPNFNMNTLVPNGIAILSAVLKKDGFKNIALFDPTFYKEEEKTWDEKRVDTGQILPFNFEDRNIKLKKTNMFEDFVHKVEDFKPDIIVTSLLEDTFTVFEKFMSHIKNKKIPCLAGGYFPNSKPEIVINSKYVDYVCRGEGEGAIVDLCNAMEKGSDTTKIENLWVKKDGKVVAKNKLRPALDVNELPVLDLSIFEDIALHRPMTGKIYRMAPVETQRGCPYRCTFCNTPEKHDIYTAEGAGRYYRKKTIENVYKELKYIIPKFNIEYIFFVTDTMLAMSEKEFDAFCEMYSEFKLPFWFNTRPETITERRAKKLKEIGLNKVNIGVEHGNKQYRKEIIGRNYENEVVIKAFDIMYNQGIPTTCNNILGYPDETRELIFDTIELVRKIKSENINAFTFIPYNGTALRALAERKKYIKKDYLCHQVETIDGIARSELDMPTISKKEIMGLVKTFTLYARMPRSYWDEIKIAEQLNEEGDKKYKELMKIYQEEYALQYSTSKTISQPGSIQW